jgi:hypothetical protein
VCIAQLVDRFLQLGTYLNHGPDEISYSDFINRELFLFSMADNVRSIPSIVDCLKPSQRKVIWACVKQKLKKEIKVQHPSVIPCSTSTTLIWPSSHPTGCATCWIQKALESLAVRHAAMTSTQHTQLALVQPALTTEQCQSTRLHDVLDKAMEQLAQETYRWRCKIALRFAVVAREGQLAEALQ